MARFRQFVFMAGRLLPAGPRMRALVLAGAVAAAAAVGGGTAKAVPSFSESTGQPCAACHIGAFGPQLTQYGRDFKQFGYVATDNLPHPLPIAVATTGSFTHTQDPIASPPPHFAANDDFAADATSVFYAGRIMPTLGAFIEVQYDGVGRDFFLGDMDIRRPGKTFELFGEDVDWGLTFNDVPTESDIWNSTPVWGFPFVSSRIAPMPAATALIDGPLAAEVAGLGAHGMWNDLLFLEFDLYRGLGHSPLNALGEIAENPNRNTYPGVIPYWRAALQHEFEEGRHYAEIGTYGISADSSPMGISTAGSDHITDYAFDATYQFVANPKDVTSTHISAHTTWIREEQHLGASSVLNGTNLNDSLSTFRADVAYSIDATWTPSLQYFQKTGSTDAALWGTANGSPNSAGIVAELMYVPWGKPGSPVNWANMRVGLQYVAYTKFDGQTAHAADNNTIFLSLKFAFAPLAPFNH